MTKLRFTKNVRVLSYFSRCFPVIAHSEQHDFFGFGDLAQTFSESADESFLNSCSMSDAAFLKLLRRVSAGDFLRAETVCERSAAARFLYSNIKSGVEGAAQC